MKVVILAGGRGTRISEESEYRPKPMIEVGGKPILWHIMKEYSYYGFNDFIICCGYKQHMIKDWFASYFLHSSDVTFDYSDCSSNGAKMEIHNSSVEPWRVTCVDTGLDTMTGGRVKRIRDYVGNDAFMLTYGDGVCDVDISKLLEFHKQHGKKATLTAVVQKQEKGVLDINDIGAVRSFREKRDSVKTSINAGYMVFEPSVFDYLTDDACILEREPLEALAKEGELMSYQHEGFWQCMDNIREREELQKLLDKGEAPWIRWKE